MGDYEKEGARLQMLWEEIESEEEIPVNDSECDEDDLHVSDHFSDTEQSGDSSEDSNDDIPLADLNRFYYGRDKTTKWSQLPSAGTKRAKRNIINFTPGVQKEAENANSEMDAWQLFFTDKIMTEIVQCTNIYIEKVRTQYVRERDAKDTNIVEMKALFGLLYLAGVFRASHTNVANLWANDGSGIEMFRNVMSLKRFEFLLRCLRFDNVLDRADRKKTDKLAPIRWLFEEFVSNCKTNYIIGEYATIDEMLEAFRGRCSFRQYMKNKPARYGIKIFSLADACSYYTLNMEIYVGKQPDGPFVVDNSAFEVVQRLVLPIENSGRNVTIDNWFTSVPLMKSLLSRNITIVGTIRKNKKEIPPEFIVAKNRDTNTSLFGFSNEATLVSYVPKKGKVVTLLSSMHVGKNADSIDVSTGDKRKPDIITFYNKTKGGVDKVDEMKQSYSVSRKSARWPLTIFFSLLNIAGINSQIVFQNNTKSNLKRREYLKNLSKALVLDFVKIRFTTSHIPQIIKLRMSEIFNLGTTENITTDTHPGRCFRCSSKKNRKTKTVCSNCSKFICKEHTVTYCDFCDAQNVEIFD